MNFRECYSNKIEQVGADLQRFPVTAQPGSSSDNSDSILRLEFKGMSRYKQQKNPIVLVQDMQMALTEMSKKLDKNHDDMKKKVD